MLLSKKNPKSTTQSNLYDQFLSFVAFFFHALVQDVLFKSFGLGTFFWLHNISRVK